MLRGFPFNAHKSPRRDEWEEEQAGEQSMEGGAALAALPAANWHQVGGLAGGVFGARRRAAEGAAPFLFIYLCGRLHLCYLYSIG
jgi:hypothetical protein